MDTQITALDRSQMCAELDVSLAQGLNLLDSVDSTNRWLSEHVQRLSTDTPFNGHSCFTEEQTSGRGRRGRVWKSVAGGDITFSMAWAPAQVDLGGALTLVAAVSLVTTIERFAGVDLSIKWPNDIYYRDRKLVGILAEATSGSGRTPARPFVIIGCGVNVSKTAGTDAVRIGLMDIIDSVDRNRLAANLLRDLAANMRRFDKEGFAGFIDQYSERDYLLGRRIVIHESRRKWHGQYVGIAADGGLQVDDDTGLRRRVHAADVTIRW